MGFQFRIEYKPGNSNKVADTLSHVPSAWHDESETPLAAFQALLSQPTFSIIQQLQHDNVTDPFLIDLHTKHSHGTLSYPFSIMNGLVVRKGRYVISPTSALCIQIISEFHDTPSGGHAGVKRTLACVAANFF